MFFFGVEGFEGLGFLVFRFFWVRLCVCVCVSFFFFLSGGLYGF